MKNLRVYKLPNEKAIVCADVSILLFPYNCILTCFLIYINIIKILHSMRLNEPPLKRWVVCEDGGIILAGHCTCIAGLGEVCTHVSAILYAVESIVRTGDKVCIVINNYIFFGISLDSKVL